MGCCFFLFEGAIGCVVWLVADTQLDISQILVYFLKYTAYPSFLL